MAGEVTAGEAMDGAATDGVAPAGEVGDGVHTMLIRHMHMYYAYPPYAYAGPTVPVTIAL